jgi:hypothetical protein
MPVTKWFCIVLGSLMVFVAVAGAPMGEPIAAHTAFAVRDAVDGLIADGSITVNTDTTLAKHPDFDASKDHRDLRAKEMVGMAVISRAARAVGSRTWPFGYVMFAMGAAWIVVGVRIGRLSKFVPRPDPSCTPAPHP